MNRSMFDSAQFPAVDPDGSTATTRVLVRRASGLVRLLLPPKGEVPEVLPTTPPVLTEAEAAREAEREAAQPLSGGGAAASASPPSATAPAVERAAPSSRDRG